MVKKTFTKTNKKVLIALSGGIDSAVSAVLLLKKGYEVEAAFMKNWSATEGLLSNECPWLDDRRQAMRVAAHLGIVLHTFDFEKEYQQEVMEYFFKEYSEGKTPNPDVMCNKEIKFKLLYEKAMQMGFDYLATGHYAEIKNNKLLRSKDEFKDQTYFIYNIKKEQFKHILFPIGGFLKNDVRKMARKFKLPNAERKESMGLCFVGKIQLDKFLQQKIPARTGNIADVRGNILGEHQGTSFYTIGQREGLKIGGTGPYYVVKKELQSNTLVVSKDFNDQKIMTYKAQVSAINWLEPSTLQEEAAIKCKARFRHQQELQDVRITLNGSKSLVEAKFKRLQRAINPGQSMVFYKNRVCLGGGVIM
jgi:tRNA-specific 2-thiouridylase